MAISRSLMNRQLRADGGIMQVAPREKFGLGSSIKKFVRKIIPNEVSEIAVKAAPFVAPFNPAVAAAMSGLGTFDQTGSIGDSLKGGALTYGLGQGARYLGGAGLQGDPFSADGGAFRGGLEGLKGGFSSPLGNQTGFKLGQPIQEIQGVGVDTSVPLQKPNILSEQISEVSLSPSGAVADVVADKSIVTQNDPGFLKNLFDGVSNQDYGKVAQTIGDGAKKFGKAMFTNKDGSVDKAAVLGAITFATSYAEARALAAETGVDEDLTEEEYNEAIKDEKKEEYAGYLTNFFGGKKDGGRIGFKDGPSESDIFGIGGETLMKDKGKTIKKGFKSIGDLILDDEGNMYTPLQYLRKFGEDIFFGGQKNPELPEEFYNKLSDEYVQEMKQVKERGYANGGRIGFESGANEMIKTQLLEEIMPEQDGEEMITIMTEDGPIQVKKSVYESMPQMFMDTTTSAYGDAGRGRPVPEFAKGGRIGFKSGTIILGEDELAEMGGEQGLKLKLLAEKFMEEGMSESDAYEKAADSLYAKGGRVSRKFGSPKEGESEIGIMTIDVEAGDDEDEEDMMMAYSDAIFDRREKAALFRSLGDPRIRQTTKSFKNLDNILKHPGMFPEDEFMLREFLKLKGFKDGGRIGYKGGANRVSELLILRDNLLASGEDVSDIEAEIFQLTGKTFKSVGGITDIPTGNMRKNNAGVVERDYRDEGGFVPVGIKERADDVPAMLSKNEFVMTADAVRGIGNGSVEEGSKKLYNTMKKAEQVGKA